jgi:hypothetical protein
VVKQTKGHRRPVIHHPELLLQPRARTPRGIHSSWARPPAPAHVTFGTNPNGPIPSLLHLQLLNETYCSANLQTETVTVVLGMDTDVWKSELSVFVFSKNVNMDIRSRIRF